MRLQDCGGVRKGWATYDLRVCWTWVEVPCVGVGSMLAPLGERSNFADRDGPGGDSGRLPKWQLFHVKHNRNSYAESSRSTDCFT